MGEPITLLLKLDSLARLKVSGVKLGKIAARLLQVTPLPFPQRLQLGHGRLSLLALGPELADAAEPPSGWLTAQAVQGSALLGLAQPERRRSLTLDIDQLRTEVAQGGRGNDRPIGTGSAAARAGELPGQDQGLLDGNTEGSAGLGNSGWGILEHSTGQGALGPAPDQVRISPHPEGKS
jgi:hypothetical protein